MHPKRNDRNEILVKLSVPQYCIRERGFFIGEEGWGGEERTSEMK